MSLFSFLLDIDGIWNNIFSYLFWFVMLFLIIGLMTMGAQKRITMRHSRSGLLKSGYVNYCWTYFFIGWMVPIVRVEIGIGMLHLALTFFTFGMFQLIMPFLYNKQYMTRLLVDGWKLHDSEELNELAKLKLGIEN